MCFLVDVVAIIIVVVCWKLLVNVVGDLFDGVDGNPVAVNDCRQVAKTVGLELLRKTGDRNCGNTKFQRSSFLDFKHEHHEYSLTEGTSSILPAVVARLDVECQQVILGIFVISHLLLVC